jgi:hypothetical protein
MRELSPERKRVAVLCACVACMAGGPVLLKGHPVLLGVWIGLMVVALAYAMVQLAKLKGQGK